MGVTPLACPSCGGALVVAEGERIVLCRYCGGRSLALISGAIPRTVVGEQVTADQARATAARILAQAPVPPQLRGRIGLRDLTLCFVPFYEFTAIRLGAFLLTTPPAKDEPEQASDHVEDLRRAMRGEAAEETRVIEQSVTRVTPACDLAALGLEHIPLERMRQEAHPLPLQPYDPIALQRKATVFAPTLSAAQVMDRMQARVALKTDRTRMVEPRLTILYYPVWLARYRCFGRLYEIALDGVTGAVLRGRAPVEIPVAALLMAIGMALAAFGAGRPTHAVLAAVGPGHWVLDLVGIGLGAVVGGALAFAIAVIAGSACRPAGALRLEKAPDLPALDIPDGLGWFASLGAALAGWLVERSLRERWE
ncbi:MAG TPA: hypothetical protein VMD08_12025 [Candidatus Baltobacteraceae bacterium]|nr:hypothetical protein [Candidatus Baltobacteraceae bacterium]